MSRRRASSDHDDSLDLLLDTVSNVFGGVMFLTLLAALLILSRGSAPIEKPEEAPPPQVHEEIDARLVQSQTLQTASELEAQRKMLARMDPDGTMAAKAEQLQSIRQTVSLARRQVQRAGSAVTDRRGELEDQQAQQSDLQEQIEQLKKEIAEKSEEMNELQAGSERTVLFRPLTMSRTMEAVMILRYGRWYLLYNGPHGELNRRDFFVLPSEESVTTITPKPHRGNPVSAASLNQLTKKLKQLFPSRQFHVTIAVWDDSFAEFNPLKDALTASGYRYRTIPCDSSSRLTNQAAVDPFVQ